MNVFDLVATLTLDSSGFDNGIEAGKSKAAGFGSLLKKGLGTAGKVAAGALVAVGTATVAATKSIIDGVASVAAYGDNIDKMSQKLGMSAQAYQEWDAILQHSGTSIDSMQRGMMTLSQQAEKNSENFQKLGISQEDVASMSQEDLFAAVIKGLQGMEEGTERATIAQQLLGGAAKELGPLLNTTAEETDAMRQRVHELGGVMDDEAVKAAAHYQDSLQDLQTSFKGLKNNTLAKLMPTMTRVMDGLTEIFSGNTESGLGMIKEGISGLAEQITEAMPAIIEVGKEIIGAIGNAILENLPELLGMGAEILINLLTGIISAIPQLIAALPEIFTAIVTTFQENWPAMKAAGAQLLTMLVSGIQSALGTALEFIRGKLSEWVAAAGEKVTEFGNRIQEGFMALVGQVSGWVNDNIITPMKDAIAVMVGVGASIVDQLLSGIKGAWSNLTSWVTSAWNKIKNIFTVTPVINQPTTKGAIGFDYIPSNNFPMLLHRGEAVLTAREAEEWRRGGSGGGGVINLNQYIQTVPQTPVELAAATEAAFVEARWAV